MTPKKPIDFLGLENKVAIVTGAATGLGAATAVLLSQAGAKVVINHIEGQADLAQAVADQCSHESLCYQADITDDNACKAMVQAATQQWGRVDVLVNSAGINNPVEHTDLDSLSTQDFLDIYRINVVGAYQMIRAVAPTMQAQSRGVVVNVSSGSGESGYGSSIAYSASKGALNTMTKSLARALAPAVRVNAICPGMVMTEIWNKLEQTEEQKVAWLKAIVDTTPLQTEPTAEIVARNILYLSSDLSAHLAGQLILADGGAALGVYASMFETIDE